MNFEWLKHRVQFYFDRGTRTQVHLKHAILQQFLTWHFDGSGVLMKMPFDFVLLKTCIKMTTTIHQEEKLVKF